MMEDDNEAAQKEAIAAKIRSQDYTGARTLLLATLQTNPRLENAFEMLSVLEVLCAAEKTLPGRGVNWCKVLQVLPGDDVARVEAQYRSIVDQLEPVRGDLPGADLALRLAREAYLALSDPKERGGSGSKDTADAANDGLAVEGAVVASGVDMNEAADDIMGNSGSHIQQDGELCLGDGCYLENAVEGNCSNTPSSSKAKRTNRCFLGGDGESWLPAENHVDKKQKSVCTKDGNCISSQVDLDSCFAAPSDVKEHNPCRSNQYDYHNFEEDRLMEHFAAGQIWATYDWEKMPRRYARVNRIVMDKMQLYVSWYRPCPEAHEEKSWCDAGLPLVCGTFVAEESKISLTGPTMFSHQIPSDIPKQHLEVYPQKGEVWAMYSDWDIGWFMDPGMRKKSAFVIVEILTSYSKDSGCMVAHLVKVDGFRSVFQKSTRSGSEPVLHVPISNLLMFSHRIPSFRFVGEEFYGILGGMLELEHPAVPENLGHEFMPASVAPSPRVPCLSNGANEIPEATFVEFSNPSTSKVDSGSSQHGIMNYRNKLSSKDFVEEQIWAVYDVRDRMPRSYVRVIHVVSPTKVLVLKLDPHPMLDEEIRWVEEGLPVACGIFRAGTESTILDMSEFSHPVECDWSAKRSFYRIFPKKGEIWAMYKNWKITLNSSDLDKCEPRMVEILSDYSDENGVNACSLTRVKGCLSFFQRLLLEDFHLTRWISRSEMLSFSHRVPAFIVVEIKARDIPKGSWHLEPNALPPRIIN